MLSRSGLVIEVASNGREGVNKVAEAHWDLVLMDINMPEMDGLSATRAIRALPGTADLPIIALTANAFQNDRNACFAAGMNDFIAKPVSPAVLQEKLMRWLPEPDAAQRSERSGEEAATPGATAQEQPSPEVLRALLTELESLLGAGDLASRQLARDNAAVLRSGLGDVAEAVFDAIEHYDYEAAQILLVRARSG
jgi:CheY-like chemotaxis protein